MNTTTDELAYFGDAANAFGDVFDIFLTPDKVFIRLENTDEVITMITVIGESTNIEVANALIWAIGSGYYLSGKR